LGGRSAPDEDVHVIYEPAPPSPHWASALSLGCLLFVLLLSNGRPIGAGDTRATEYLSKSLVEHGTLTLDEAPEVEPPFARTVRGHRVSIYPALSAVLAAPVFALGRSAFALDETGSALCGKIAASLFSALAAVLLFLSVASRHGETKAALAAVLFALGTSVCSTSQALWQHPAAVLFLSWTLLWVARAGEDPKWVSRAGLPLSLAVAARHADVALALGLLGGIALLWPRRLPALLLWALPGVLFVAWYNTHVFGAPWSQGFSGSLPRFALGLGHLGLLLSPGKGLFVFTPLALCALAGIVQAHRVEGPGVPALCGAGVFAHWLLMGFWSEWDGGESFGPRMMTDALPLLFLFLPEGLALFGRLGTALAVFSVLVQGIGAFAADDYRWERLYARPPRPGHPELWSVADSPIVYYLERRVVILALPDIRGGRAFIRDAPFVVLGPKGSRARFSEDSLGIRGSDPTFSDCYLQYGARVRDRRLELKGRWDGLFLRVLPEARGRTLELRVLGRGRGVLYVGERTFWSPAPLWKAYPVSGDFRVVHPYSFPLSGGADLRVTVGKNGGDLSLSLVALVPRGDPDQPIEAP
jgi:hypothetical protein